MLTPYKNLVKPTLFATITLLLLYTGYALEFSYFKFLPSSLGIISLSSILYGKKGFKILGLKSTWKFYITTICATVILSTICHKIIRWIITTNTHLTYKENYDHIIVNIFQTLNEEIVFRSLLLLLLLQIFPANKLKNLLGLLIIPAAFFSALHYLFFAHLVKPELQGLLTPLTYTTIFFFGIAANAFYLTYKNILIPWVIHYSWNVSRYSFELEQKSPLLEYQTFNLLEGSWQVTLLSATLAIIALYTLYSATTKKKYI